MQQRHEGHTYYPKVLISSFDIAPVRIAVNRTSPFPNPTWETDDHYTSYVYTCVTFYACDLFQM